MAEGTTGARVNRQYRKACAGCGADLTFARRHLQADGSVLCETCVAAGKGTSSGAGATDGEIDFAALGDFDVTKAPESALPPPVVGTGATTRSGKGAGAKAGAGAGGGAAVVGKPGSGEGATPASGRRSGKWLWVSAGVLVLAGVTAGATVLYRATFGRNREEAAMLVSLQAGRQLPDRLMATSRPVEAFDEYVTLLARVKGMKPSSMGLRDEIESIRFERERAERAARPILERRAAEERARREAEGAAKREAERAAAERKRQAEEAERERKRQEAAERERAAREREVAARMARVRQDPRYSQLKRDAEQIRTELQTGLIGEDSAYRGMSRRSDALGRLMSTYLRLRAMASDETLIGRIDAIEQQARIAMIGEDSAIRATYKRQMVVMQLTSVWAELTGDRVVVDAVRSSQVAAGDTLAGDDSAIRAIYQYTRAGMNSLAAIASGTGQAAGAREIVAAVERDNAGDDSAWRAAGRCADGLLDLLLLLSNLPEEQRRSIRSDVNREMIGEDSALRAYGHRLDGAIETVSQMIGRL